MDQDRLTWVVAAIAWFNAVPVLRRSTPAATVTALLGLAWLAPATLGTGDLWHRGPLIHLLVAGGAWWPRSRVAQVAVVLGYALVAFPAAWAQVEVALAMAALIVVAAVVERETRAFSLLRRRPWQVATILFGLAVATPPVLAEAGTGAPWATHVLTGYESALVLVALLVVVAVRPWNRPWAADLAVDLGQASPRSLEVALASHVSDPDAVRAQTEDALKAAARLRRQLDERQGALDRALADTQESWLRLTAADAEARQSLLIQIEALTGERLESLVDDLTRVATVGQGVVSTTAQRARLHLLQAGEELDALGHGLTPAVLADGLLPALRAIGAASPVPVRLTVSDESACDSLEHRTAATVYLVTAEILTNAVKHARATSIRMDLRTGPDRLEVTIEDDGVGGIPEGGSGLNGVRERVLETGGSITLSSPPGHGSTVRLSLPVPS